MLIPLLSPDAPVYHPIDNDLAPSSTPYSAAANDYSQSRPQAYQPTLIDDTRVSAAEVPYIPPVQDLINRSPIRTVVPRVENLLGPNLSPGFSAPPLQYTSDSNASHTIASYIPASEPAAYKPSGPIASAAIDEIDNSALDSVANEPATTTAPSVSTAALDELESGQVEDSMQVDAPPPPPQEGEVIKRKNSISISGLVNPDPDVDGEAS